MPEANENTPPPDTAEEPLFEEKMKEEEAWGGENAEDPEQPGQAEPEVAPAEEEQPSEDPFAGKTMFQISYEMQPDEAKSTLINTLLCASGFGLVMSSVMAGFYIWALKDPHGNGSKLHCFYKEGGAAHLPFIPKEGNDPLAVDMTNRFLIGLKLGAATFSALTFTALVNMMALCCKAWACIDRIGRVNSFFQLASFVTFVYSMIVSFSEAGAVCGGKYLLGQPTKEFEGRYAVNAYWFMHGLGTIQLWFVGLYCGCIVLGIFLSCIVMAVQSRARSSDEEVAGEGGAIEDVEFSRMTANDPDMECFVNEPETIEWQKI